jgi:hypothetical protein
MVTLKGFKDATLDLIDDQIRSKHIIENMLFMIELNPINVAICIKIFNMIDANAKPNVNKGDFLQDSVYPDKKFDIIVGNPPFQISQEGTREGGYGGRTLWDNFIVKCLNETLIQNGFLGFINPPPWRKPEHELWNLMTQENQLLYLHIYNKKQGHKLFHVSQRIDLYIIKKTPPYTKTDIIDELGNELIGDKAVDLKKWGFLPNYAFDNIRKIMTTEDNGIKIIYSRSLYGTDKHNMCDKQQDAECIMKDRKGIKIVRKSPKQNFQYPVVHSINQDHSTNPDGFVLWYSSEIKKDKYGHSHFGEPKVLLNFNENQYPVNDFEGKYGMSQITFGIPITSKKEGDDIVKAINSEEFKEIINATKWGAFQTDWRMFKYFKPDFYKDFIT